MWLWLFRIITLSVAGSFVSLGVFVYLKNPQSKIHRSFFDFNTFISLWSFGFFLTLFSQLPHGFTLWASRVSHLCGGLTAVLFLRFVIFFLGLDLKKLRDPILATLAFGAAISCVLPWMITSLRPKLFFPYYPEPGPLYPVFLANYFYGYIRGFYFLFHAYRNEQRELQQQMQAILTLSAVLIGWLSVATLFLPIYNIEFTPLLGFLPVFAVVFVYAIIRYHLLDIEVFIRRTAVFAGLFAFVYGVFTVVTMVGQEFFRRNLGWNQWVAMVPTVIVITFALRPLENFLTNATERFLFQKKYDYRELLRVFTNEILTFLDLQRLTEQTVAGLGSIVKLESAAVLLHDKDAQAYKVVAGQNLKQKDVVFGEDHTLIRYLKVSHKPILRDKDADKMHHDGDMNLAFRALNAQLCLPIQSHDLLIGILSLGMKKSGEDYTAEELDILMTLARTEAIAISNAQLFDELSKTKDCLMQREKMAAVGTLAAGMAHEIKNPLAAIRTFTDYLPAKYGESEFREKFCRIVSQEVGRICDIVNNLLIFSKPASSLKRLCSVNDPLRDILDLLSNEFLKRNVCVVSDFQEHQIWVDPSQLKQAFLNVILNAIDAMKARGGSLDVRTRVDAHGVEVRIADTGQGISTENIPRIFDPFYTDKEGGTGLGLAITHSLVEKNGGRIAVESGVGKGTVFVMKFENAVQ